MSDLENKIKSIIALNGETLTSTAGKMNIAVQSLSQKLKRGIKYTDVEEILDVLGYKIEWVKK